MKTTAILCLLALLLAPLAAIASPPAEETTDTLYGIFYPPWPEWEAEYTFTEAEWARCVCIQVTGDTRRRPLLLPEDSPYDPDTLRFVGAQLTLDTPIPCTRDGA